MRVTVLMDGGFLRSEASKARKRYVVDLIEEVARSVVAEGEYPLRFMYYDCPPYRGTLRLPVSGQEQIHDPSDQWLKDLARRELFATRLGILKFRGFIPRRVLTPDRPLQDDDFKPRFEQKGVDMRIGLDIATFSAKKSVERIILLSGDTDCVPAMKHARIEGLQIVLGQLPGHRLAAELVEHADFVRDVRWPAGFEDREMNRRGSNP